MSNTDFWACCNDSPGVGVFEPELASWSTRVAACAAGVFFLFLGTIGAFSAVIL